MPEGRLRESKVFTSEMPDTGKEVPLWCTFTCPAPSWLYWKLAYLAVDQTMTNWDYSQQVNIWRKEIVDEWRRLNKEKEPKGTAVLDTAHVTDTVEMCDLYLFLHLALLYMFRGYP